MNMDINKYNKYNIRDNDRFYADQFPKATLELQILANTVAAHPGAFTEMIVISYLKYHSLKKEWSEANPWLSDKMSDGSCTTDHLESLFTSSKGNPQFTKEYEEYILSVLASAPVAVKGSL
jgi:hypothetical protein